MRILLIMAMLMGVLSAPLASAASDQNGALVAVGDSITSGYYLGSDDQRPSEDAFPYLVGKDEGWGVIDLGVPGWKSGDLLNALESLKFQQSLQDSDTVLMSIGSNDLLQRALPFLVRMSDEKHPLSLREWQQLTVEGIAAIMEFQENLPKILEEVRKETSSPIIVYTIYNPFPPGHTLHSMAKLFIDPMNGIIAQTVASKGDPAILLADAASRFEGHQLEWVRLSERDVHPTQEGQRVLADLAKEALAFSRINPENRE